MDIATLQETHLADSGTLCENCTFIGKGKCPVKTREHGIGSAIKNSLLPVIEPGEDRTERILALCLHSMEGPVKPVSVHARTLHSSQEAKDQFYDQLQSAIQVIPRNKQQT